VAHLVARAVDPDFEPLRTSPPERRVTDEGEYAALVVQEGRSPRGAAVRLLGYVLGDDWYASLIATVFATEQATRFRDVVETLLASDAHALGLRRRRFLYRAPAGWQGRNLDTFHAAWFPPDHPRDRSRLTVCPARPLPGSAGLAGLEALTGEPTRDFVADVQIGPRRGRQAGAVMSRYQVTGACAGQPMVRDVTLLQDERHVYPLIVDSPPELATRNQALLAEVAASVELLPRPPGGEGDLFESIDHWV
jgi:hypothetical protein